MATDKNEWSEQVVQCCDLIRCIRQKLARFVTDSGIFDDAVDALISSVDSDLLTLSQTMLGGVAVYPVEMECDNN